MKTYFVCLLSLIVSCLSGQVDEQRMYIFGHSLIDHRPPINPTPSDETTVPHWLYLLSQEAGRSFQAAGQYGFLTSHDNLPPQAQWGYDIVPGAWDQDNESFADADLYTVLITAANFIQYQAPDLAYEDPNNTAGDTPISATITIVDWLKTQEDDSLTIYLYENWPDMAGFLSNGWPASANEFANYNNYLNGDFHQWWIDYHDALILARPNDDIKMIPVGPIIADLLGGLLSEIPLESLYEDDAPHGRPSIYFLASLITYMATNEEKAPSTFSVPAIIDQAVSENYQEVINFIWAELNSFTDHEGNSRVFINGSEPPEMSNRVNIEGGPLFIDNDDGIILRGRDSNCYNIFVNQSGELIHERVNCPN